MIRLPRTKARHDQQFPHPPASAKPYSLRIVATDNEPTPRRTAVYANLRGMKELNSLTTELTSNGKKEEIEFNVTVEPAAKN